jgi:Predicted dithiol-disulfide isomerase involved in polyketide biosynthesis
MIGKVPLDQLAKNYNLTVEWKAFELRPEGIEIPEKSPSFIARAKAGIEALGQKNGLKMTFNENSKHSNLALEGSKYAEEHGLENAYHDAVFAAQFQEEKNINDLQVLTEIAVRIGLDREDFLNSLAARKYKKAVLADEEEAQRLGIHLIPCFIVDGLAVNGAQSYESLEKLLQGHGFKITGKLL